MMMYDRPAHHCYGHSVFLLCYLPRATDTKDLQEARKEISSHSEDMCACVCACVRTYVHVCVLECMYMCVNCALCILVCVVFIVNSLP